MSLAALLLQLSGYCLVASEVQHSPNMLLITNIFVCSFQCTISSKQSLMGALPVVMLHAKKKNRYYIVVEVALIGRRRLWEKWATGSPPKKELQHKERCGFSVIL